MANKKITDVDFIESLDSNESFFVNQNNTLRQINRANIVFGFANGGIGANNGEDGLQNLLASGNMILSSYQYGDTLPEAGVKGRIFFKKILYNVTLCFCYKNLCHANI